jgi:opacity protein-like surface antigen
MSMKRMKWIQAVMMTCVLAAVPNAAFADGFVIPFLGINFGGDAGQTFEEAAEDGSKLTWGVRAGGMASGIFGAEVDFSRTNNFFGDYGALGNNSVTTLMPAVIIGIPVGGQQGLGIRPYLTAGVGLIRREFDVAGFEVFKSNKAGYSLGGGVMGFFGTHIGISGDYRYFRTLDEDEIEGLPLSLGTFNYSRATAGVVFRF